MRKDWDGDNDHGLEQAKRVIQLRLFHADNADGTMQLRTDVELVRQAADILLADACAAFEPRPYHSTRKPDQAVGTVERMRMGRTEHGSFLLTVLSRIPPVLRQILLRRSRRLSSRLPLPWRGFWMRL